MKRKQWKVDYTVIKNHSHSRQSRFINQSQLPGNATSEFSIESFLKHQYKDSDVQINSIIPV